MNLNLGHPSQIKLSDGRQLGYQIYGNPNGTPVLYNHGWPACRLEAGLFDTAATEAGVKLIGIDRPGYGLSDFLPERALIDWPTDIAALADHLGLDRFHIMGLSGGGPYTIVTAYQIPERLLGATVVAGVSPMTERRTMQGMRLMNKILLNVGRPFPWLLNQMMKITANVGQDPAKLQRAMRDLPAVDKALIGNRIDEMQAMVQGAFAQGTAGPTQDGRIYALPWGFELDQVTFPITIWQGTLDVNVPRSNSELLAEKMPNATLNMIEGEGHLSLAANLGGKILGDLISGTA